MQPRRLYDDGRISCDAEGVRIAWYYPWGAKRIPYRSIRSATTFELSAARGRWRLWGSGDLIHWYNLDTDRPGKTTGLDLDVGRRVHPCITPTDTSTVAGIIHDHMSPRP